MFKSLITIHHLMSHGNERFTQYLATSNHSFELNDFLDRTTPQGYNMSNFVRNYAKYINDKTISYRTLALDLCKIRSGNDNALRTMNMDNLSKTLPIVQKQFDSLLDFNAESKDLNNGIIMAAFRLLYKDLVKMYVAYQEAIINLLERYFKLSRRKTHEALEMYRKYLARMDRVANFLRVVDSVGLDKSEMPDLTNSPASILKVLEDHLAGLEAKKRGGAASASPEREHEGEKSPEKEVPKASSAEVDKGNDKKIAPSSRAEQDQEKQSSSGEPASLKAGQGTSERQVEAPKKPPPARPAASPKVSPSGSKPPPIVTAPTSERKSTPPERPAKPPSRPPPPAASGTSGSSAIAAQSSSSKQQVAANPAQAEDTSQPASRPAGDSTNTQLDDDKAEQSGSPKTTDECEKTTTESAMSRGEQAAANDENIEEHPQVDSPPPPPPPDESLPNQLEANRDEFPSCSASLETSTTRSETRQPDGGTTNHIENNISHNHNSSSQESGTNGHSENGLPGQRSRQVDPQEASSPNGNDPPTSMGQVQQVAQQEAGAAPSPSPSPPPPPPPDDGDLQPNGSELNVDNDNGANNDSTHDS